MRTPKNYLLRKEFESWLKKQKITSFNQYTRLDKYPGTNYLYYDVIASFLFHHERSYAYSVLEKWGEEIRNKVKNGGQPQSANPITYWNRYKEFIHSFDDNGFNANNVISEPDLAPIRKFFNKGNISPIDGMDGLVNRLGGVDAVIKLAIEDALFMDKEIVCARFREVLNEFQANKPLPARKSQRGNNSQNIHEGYHHQLNGGKWYYDENKQPICQINPDNNGNANVCSVINRFTGYNLNVNLAVKPIKNYITSHVWGRAIDPRYFTNLWNVVLVPAWVNHLLDKDDNNQGTLTAKLKDTFKCICSKYYELSNPCYDWNALKMSIPICNGNVLKGTYDIQIIKEKDKSNGSRFGKIVKTKVTI